MSSNPAELSSGVRGNPARRPWSLTVLLTVATAVSSCVILAFVSIQMYLLLAHQLKEQNIRYLRDEVETLAQMARLSGFEEVLAEEMHVEPVGEEYLTHYVRLLDKGGRRIIETPNMEHILPRDVFPPPDEGGKVSNHLAVRGQNGASYLLAAIWIDSEIAGAEREVLQVGLDVTNVENILAGYRRRLILTLGIGFVLCAVTGLVIARRGTRPILEITDKARQITVSRLDERLGGPGWPRELNTLADALNGMLDRLQDSFARLYNSATNLAHKMRTPLTVLRGEAEVALSQPRTVEELQDVISSSLEEYGRLSRLSENILLLASMEMGRLQPVMAEIDAAREIANIRDYYEPLAEEKGIAVTCRGTLTVTADPSLFRKAVANLFVNSLTYTQPGGSVTITIGQGADGAGEISVTDTGCGIAEAELEKIFDRFYRVYATRYMDLYCSGLGLPIARAIMELHKGEIVVQSQPGQGTTVMLKFPPPAS